MYMPIARETPDVDPPPSLDDHSIPFAAPVGVRVRHAPRRKKKRVSMVGVAIFAVVYALGAAVTGVIGHDVLLSAWLVGVPPLALIARAMFRRS